MKVFEKVYWTLAVVSGFLLVAGMFAGFVWENETLMLLLWLPFGVLAAVMLLDVLVCEVILRAIWKVDFTLFPSLFSVFPK